MANTHKVGLVFGTIFGGLHLIWTLLVAIDWAQPLVDFFSWAHMVMPVHAVESFDFTAAATLVILATCVGYIIGSVGARTWNYLHQ